MPICRSSGALKTWVIECYKHIAPLALKSEEIDSNEFYLHRLQKMGQKMDHQNRRI
jgi:hypothetical protein